MYDITDHVVLILPKNDAYQMVAVWQRFRAGELRDATIPRTNENASPLGDPSPTDLGGQSPEVEHAKRIAESLESRLIPMGAAKRQVEQTQARQRQNDDRSD